MFNKNKRVQPTIDTIKKHEKEIWDCIVGLVWEQRINMYVKNPYTMEEEFIVSLGKERVPISKETYMKLLEEVETMNKKIPQQDGHESAGEIELKPEGEKNE